MTLSLMIPNAKWRSFQNVLTKALAQLITLTYSWMTSYGKTFLNKANQSADQMRKQNLRQDIQRYTDRSRSKGFPYVYVANGNNNNQATIQGLLGIEWTTLSLRNVECSKPNIKKQISYHLGFSSCYRWNWWYNWQSRCHLHGQINAKFTVEKNFDNIVPTQHLNLDVEIIPLKNRLAVK